MRTKATAKHNSNRLFSVRAKNAVNVMRTSPDINNSLAD